MKVWSGITQVITAESEPQYKVGKKSPNVHTLIFFHPSDVMLYREPVAWHLSYFYTGCDTEQAREEESLFLSSRNYGWQDRHADVMVHIAPDIPVLPSTW